MVHFQTLDELQQALRACRLCAENNFEVGSQPIFSGSQRARLMLVGQAPGISEGDLGYPFGGDAGRRLFQWLDRAGWQEQEFRRAAYITSVTRCFPGKSASGSGDRVPSAAERTLCRPWLDGELDFVQPEVIVPVGTLAIKVFLGNNNKLSDVVGTTVTDDLGRQLIPLPHPSGASRWFNNPTNLARLERAIFHLNMARITRNL